MFFDCDGALRVDWPVDWPVQILFAQIETEVTQILWFKKLKQPF